MTLELGGRRLAAAARLLGELDLYKGGAGAVTTSARTLRAL